MPERDAGWAEACRTTREALNSHPLRDYAESRVLARVFLRGEWRWLTPEQMAAEFEQHAASESGES